MFKCLFSVSVEIFMMCQALKPVHQIGHMEIGSLMECNVHIECEKIGSHRFK